MAKKIRIKIEREYAFMDLFRDYQVLLDDKIIGKLAPEGAIEFDAEVNSRIKLKIDWCYSNEIKINDYRGADHIYLKAKSNIHGWKRFALLYYIFFKRNKYINLSISEIQ